MPINKKFKHWYGADWTDLANQLKWNAHWRCQRCNAKHGETIIYHPDYPDGWQLFQVPRAIPTDYEVVLVQVGVAHLNHKPWDRSAGNLMVLCRGCHLRHDAPQHAKTRAMNNRLRLIEAGQQELGL